MLRRITVLAVFAAVTHLAAQQDFQWNGQLTTGQTLEIKGINGDIHAGPSSTTGAAVTAIKSARRRGRSPRAQGTVGRVDNGR